MDQPTSRPQLNHSRSCPNIPELVVENDDDGGSEATQQQLPAPEEQHDDDLNDSSDTLVDAVLDHRDARDRHVRFQEHVVESAALVERMLSLSGGRRQSTSPVNRYQAKINHDIDEPEDDIDDKFSDKGSSTATSKTTGVATPNAGGSVLSSLMRLEAQRRQKEQEYELKKQQRKSRRVSVINDVSHKIDLICYYRKVLMVKDDINYDLKCLIDQLVGCLQIIWFPAFRNGNLRRLHYHDVHQSIAC